MEKDERSYLSPRQILSYLRDFEVKLPAPPPNDYLPSLTGSVVDKEDINAEANRMLKFLGMEGYTATCRLADLGGKYGGFINLDESKRLDITLEKSLCRNPLAAVATLAHEICHKYLQIHGIYVPEVTIVNEIYTDLCTIYVGFGECIRRGYHTHTAHGTWSMGYLRKEIYNDVSILIDTVARGKELPAQDAHGQGTWDIWLWEGLKCWTSDNDKRRLSKQNFINAFTSISDYKRTQTVLLNLLKQIDEFIVHRAETIDSRILNEEFFNSESKALGKFAIFSDIYEGTLLAADYEIDQLSAANETLKHSIVAISKALGEERLSNRAIGIETFECPHCHKMASTSVLTEPKAIIRCSRCNHRFAVDTESFKLRDAVNSFNKYVSSLEAPIRLQYDSRLKSVRQEGYVEGFTDGKNGRVKELNALKDKIDSLPAWLKWLIGSRLD